MAKRTPRSQANDSITTAAATEPKARPRSRSSATGAPVAEPPGPFAGDADDAARTSAPSDDDIRRRAYQRYLERGGGHGMDFDDWLEAERELKKRSR